MNAIDKLHSELSELAAAVKAQPHKAEEAVDTWLLRMRNRRFSVGRLAGWAIGIFIAGAIFGNMLAAWLR